MLRRQDGVRTLLSSFAQDDNRLQVFLDEPGTQMHIDLHEWPFADVAEAVHFAGLDDEDVAGPGFELVPLDVPEAASLADELDLVVGMPVRPRTTARLAVEEKHR